MTVPATNSSVACGCSPHWARDRAASISIAVGSAVFVTYSAALLLAGAMFLLGQPLHRAILPAAAACGASSIFLVLRSTQRKGLMIASAFALIVLITILSYLVAWAFYDVSYDAQWYHQESAIQLASGWNPVARELNAQEIPAPQAAWRVNHFARGSAVISGCIYQFTEKIELIKGINLLLTFASGLLALGALLRLRALSVPQASVLAVVLALNPVCVVQAFCSYVDGQLWAALLGVLAGGLLFWIDRRVRWLWLMTAGIVIAINLKFSGIAFAGAIVGVLIIVLLSVRAFRAAMSAALFGMLGLVLAVAVAGFSPYVTNSLNYGHPFHPLQGPSRNDFDWRIERPIDFNELNRFERLARSLFAHPGNDHIGRGFERSRPMVPFIFPWHENTLRHYYYPDVRIAGFGPLFSGALLLAFVALPWIPLRLLSAIVLLVMVLVGSALLNEEAWWARYSPHLWAIPSVIALAGFITTRRPAQILCWLIVFVLAVNVTIIAIAHTSMQIRWNREVASQLAELRLMPQPLRVVFGEFPASRIRLRDAGIDFVAMARDLSDQPYVGLFMADWHVHIYPAERPTTSPAAPAEAAPAAAQHR